MRTTDKDQATLRSAQLTVHFQKLILKLKQDGPLMTPAEIDTLVERWLTTQIDTLEDSLADSRMTYERLDELNEGYSDITEILQEKMMLSDYRTVSPEADEILKDAGLPLLDHRSIEFKKLCRRLLRAQIELEGIANQRVNGNYPARPVPSTGLLPSSTAPPVRPTPLFSVIVKKYLAEKTRAKRTAEPVRVEFEKYIATIGGDRPIAEITKMEGRKYREDLIQVRKVALGTVAQRVHTISGCFTWAKRMGYVPDGWPNPMQGLAPSKDEYKKGMRPRRPFTTEELLTIFSSPNFIKQRELQPARYWIVLLCLYQLCRREEAAQLAPKDIGEQDGIPYLMITDLGEDQSVKNDGSRRTMPIHSSLIALGFLDYVQSIRKAKHARLFPQLSLEGFRYADPIGKWFAGHLNKVGLSQPELVTHSLRHGIHYLHALGCPSDVAEMLTGHTASSVHNGYEHRELTKLTRLQEGLEKMQFKEVLEALTKAV